MSNSEHLDGLFQRMSPKARTVFSHLRAKAGSEDFNCLLSVLSSVDFRCEPVDVKKFLLHPQYLGTGVAETIYPTIIDDLQEIFAGEFNEILLSGGIGWGKSRMAELGIAYELYLLSSMKAPAISYGLMPGSKLAFLNVSVTQSQAERVLFGGLRDLICRSPYFRENFPFEPSVRSEIRFPQNVVCYPVASTESSMLGEGVFSAAFDEMNFMPVIEHSKHQREGGTYDQAVVLYNRLSRRIRSRMNQRGHLPGHQWLISSARYPNDFTERKPAEARTDKRIFVRNYPAWGTRPKHFFVPESFKVEFGDSTRRSRVLRGDELDVNPEHVIEVPTDFRNEFEKDTDGAVRDYAGISVLAIRPFIVRRDLVSRMFQLGDELGLKHPFSKCDVTLQDEGEYLIPENLHWIVDAKKNNDGRILFDRVTRKQIRIRKLCPALYFAHVDLAKRTDACGIAIGHVVGKKNVQRGSGLDVRLETKPVIRVDLVLRVVAPPQGEILASNVRGIFYSLSKLGIQFGKISYDSFGSLESIQTLTGEGFPAETFSVDKNLSAYEQLKSAIYDERVLCYRVPKLEEELLSLELDEKRGKVDHGPLGSKDLTDALAGVIAHCEGNSLKAMASAASVPTIGQACRSYREELWERAARGEIITMQEFNAL